jgi:hypothetical protein
MLQFAAVFGVATVYVGLRSLQQLNVQHSMYAGVFPVSLMMALADSWMIAVLAATGVSGISVAYGLGGGTGCTISIMAHKWWRSRNVKIQNR